MHQLPWEFVFWFRSAAASWERHRLLRCAGHLDHDRQDAAEGLVVRIVQHLAAEEAADILRRLQIDRDLGLLPGRHVDLHEGILGPPSLCLP